MSYFSAADPRPKSIHVGNCGVERMSTRLNQVVSSNHPVSAPYARPMFYVDDASSSRPPLATGHPEFKTSAKPQQIPSSLRPPYWATNSNIPARVAQYDPPEPRKVRVPLAPRSCPPCSPVTRIFPSMSVDGAVSPGTKTVSFEVDNTISDDHILVSVQELRENLEKKGKPQFEVIPVLHLKDPPKGKGKRPLSSDSDSFSSDLTNSSVSFNSSVASDSFQKSLKSPEEDLHPPSVMSSLKSPKKVKADSDHISPSRKMSDSKRSQADDKGSFQSNDCAGKFLKVPVFTFPQSPSKADNFCSTPLEQAAAGNPKTPQHGDKSRGRLESESPYRNVDSRDTRADMMRRASTSPCLHVANSDSRVIPKSLSMSKADVHHRESFQPSPLKTVEKPRCDQNAELNNKYCKTIQSAVHPTRSRKSIEPNVFIFPEVKKPSNADEVDGFGSEAPMDMEMDVDSYDDRGFQYGQHNPFQGNGAFQSQHYGLYSNESQTQLQYSQGRYSNSMTNYENQRSTLQAPRFPRVDNNTYYRDSDTNLGSAQAGSGGYGRFYGDDLDSVGTPPSRARQKSTEVGVKTPKDNRTKIASSGYEDVLDISEEHEDVDQALGKFADQESAGQGSYMSSKQDFNNNLSRNGIYNSRQVRYEENYSAPALVNTRADTNVCFVSPHELPDSDMSCDDMDDYGGDDEDAGLMGYMPGHAGRHQRYWDETDSLLCNREDANTKNKSSKWEINSPSNQSTGIQKSPKNTPKAKKEKYSSCERTTMVSNSNNASTKCDSGEISLHTRHPSSSPLNKVYRNMTSNTFPKDYNNSSPSTKSQPVQTKPHLNSSPIPSVRAATLNKTSENKIPVETKTGRNRNFADRYGESPLKNNQPPYVGQRRDNTHPTPVHKNAEEICKPRQASFKHPAKYSESKTLRHHPWVPGPPSRNSSYVFDDHGEDVEDCSSGGDEVDGFGDGEATTPNKEDPGRPSSPPSKRAALDNKDDVIHCFDTSGSDDGGEAETLAAQQIRESLPSRMQLASFQTMRARSSDFPQKAETPNVGTNGGRPGFTPKKRNCDVDLNTTNCKPAYSIQMDTILPCKLPGLPNAKDLDNTEGAVFLESSPDLHTLLSSRENQRQNKQHHCTESKDDISLSCVSSHELRDIFPRRASDTSGTISPNHVIPRTRSSPSKLENSLSGEKLRKVTFHRPWVTPDDTKFASRNSPLNVLAMGIPNVSYTQSTISTQSSATRIVDNLGFPPLRNYRTPESTQVVTRYNSTSDPNKYSDQFRSEFTAVRAGRVDSPAKRNRVDRRLDFEGAHQVMDKNQQLVGTAANTRVTGSASETTSSPASRPEPVKSADTGSASAFREYDGTSSGVKINGNPSEGAPVGQLEGGAAAGVPKPAGNRGAAGVSSVSETETRLKRIQRLIASRGESGNPREDNEIDIKIEVSDSLRLSERLEQIYQSNERRCECARIEQEILTNAMDLFGELCDPSKRFDNWKAALRDTNAVIRDSLEVADDCRRLCSHGRTVSDVFPGSVILRVKCRTLMSVVDLCHMRASGELHGLLNRMLCARVQMTRLALKVSLDSENVQRCTRFLLRALQLTEKSDRTSQRKACPDRRSGQGLSNCVRSSPSTPTVRIATHARCSSSPSLYIHSPIYAHKSGTPAAAPATPDRRERTFSFGETRIALQELDGPTSPLGSSSRWNCSPRPASSPLLPPRLRTPPMMTSPVTSPRAKLKRCDVIQEQENMMGGGGSVDFAS